MMATLDPKDLPNAIAQVKHWAAVVRSAQRPLMFDIFRKAIQELTGQ